jgi:predicted RNase H-like HicB family nuclease
MKDYHINIFYSDADKGYIADIPDRDACSAFGKTPTDALKQAQLAKKLCLKRLARRINLSPNRVTDLSSSKPAHKFQWLPIRQGHAEIAL